MSDQMPLYDLDVDEKTATAATIWMSLDWEDHLRRNAAKPITHGRRALPPEAQ